MTQRTRFDTRFKVPAALLSVFLIAGCAAGQGRGDSNYDGPPKSGGTLVYHEPEATSCMAMSNAHWLGNGAVINQMTDKLTYQDPKTLEIKPWLATRWTINEDSTEYVFTLREDVSFSDGSVLDADVVKANYDARGLGNETLGLAKQVDFSGYLQSEVMGKHKIRVQFSKPAPDFLQATSELKSGIVAARTISLPYDEQCDLKNLSGSGPYVLESFTQDKETILASRTDYDWAPASRSHQGPAYLDKIQFLVSPERSARIGSLLSDQADVVRDVPPIDERRVAELGFELFAPVAHGTAISFWLRPENSLFQDPLLRKALQVGINRQELLDTIFTKNYTLASSVLTPAVRGYTDLSTELEFDQEKAKSLLDEAGWIVGKDGIRSKDGEKLEFSMFILETYPQAKEMDELVAQQLREIGVKMNLIPRDLGTWAEQMPNPEAVGILEYMMGRAAPAALQVMFDTEALDILRHDDAKLDKMVRSQSALTDPDERIAALGEIQKYVIDQAYVIPLFDGPYLFGTSPVVHGMNFTSSARPDLYDVWLSR